MLEVELLAISSEDCGLCHSWWWWWRGVGVGEKLEVHFKCKRKNSTHVNRRKVRAPVGVRRRIPVAQTLPARPKKVRNGFCVTCICGMIMWCFVFCFDLFGVGMGGGGGGGGLNMETCRRVCVHGCGNCSWQLQLQNRQLQFYIEKSLCLALDPKGAQLCRPTGNMGGRWDPRPSVGLLPVPRQRRIGANYNNN